MTERYERIINLRKEPSPKHPRMSLYDRAAQFAPFAALTGLESAICEEARLTDRRIDLDEYEIEQIDAKLRLIAASDFEPRFAVTYFIKDEKKSGGIYITKKGKAKRIDRYTESLIMEDGTVIPINEIINIIDAEETI